MEHDDSESAEGWFPEVLEDCMVVGSFTILSLDSISVYCYLVKKEEIERMLFCWIYSNIPAKPSLSRRLQLPK
jgi:hypothetical protein